MKRTLVLSLLFVAALSFAQDATVSFVDGFVDVRTQSGQQFPADFGTDLDIGDRVITEGRSFAELELASGGVIEIDSDTVFILGTGTDRSGQPQSRMAAAVGSFAFRFNAALGNEPQIGSTTSAGGVRGTEVRVYAASDGTTRYEVIEGLLEVQEGGRTVQVRPDEAVEVRAGQAPTAVFSFLEQPIDYGIWNAGLVDDFLSDPLSTLTGIGDEMNDLIDEIERRKVEYEALAEDLAEKDAAMRAIEDDEARQERFNRVVVPAQNATRESFVGMRFVVLSALSLDQYVLARLGAEMQATNFDDPENPTLLAFLDRLSQIRQRYEASVVPWLVPSDL
jgi:hypothetical protein